MSRRLDRVVSALIAILLMGLPLAFGGVHRTALVSFETASFCVLIAWFGKIWLEAPATPRLPIEKKYLRNLSLAVGAIALLPLLQLAPLPPPLMRWVAPADYRLFKLAYPGWPAASPSRALAPLVNRYGHLENGFTHRWLPLAIAPGVSWSCFIEELALVSIFAVVLGYTFGLVGERDAERRFYRMICAAILLSGIVVAALGLAERAWWNGKLWWCWVPEDWRAPMIGLRRATGPFVDPDHFADYLAMILPLSVTGALYPAPLVQREHAAPLRTVCGLASLMMTAALLLSQSRAGWAAGAVGVALSLFLMARYAPGSAVQRIGARAMWLGIAGAGVGLIVLIATLGPGARADLSGRVAETLPGGGVAYRFGVWRDTLAMVADYPVFGVGLGGWPDLFPHYHAPPWMPFFFREAENDYLQFVAETGLLGLAALVCFATGCLRALIRAAAPMPKRVWPLFAGLLGGLSAAVVHEFFDFSLRIPANALLFTVLLALCLRIALTEGIAREGPRLRAVSRPSRIVGLGAAAAIVVMIGMSIAAFRQQADAYPYHLTLDREPQLGAALLSHPAMARVHTQLAEALRRAGSLRLSDAQFRAAVWLDPNQPQFHDEYAALLLTSGDRRAGLAQITQSVFHAPRIESHAYLSPALVNWLLPAEQEAIARGFRQAAAEKFYGAMPAMIAFERDLGRYREAAEVLLRAAQRSASPAQKIDYLCEAVRDFAQAQEDAAALGAARAAIKIDPLDPSPYAAAATALYGPRGDMPAAEEMIGEGLRAGADPSELTLALADAAAAAHDRAAEERALEARRRYGSRFDLAMRLGALYFTDNKFSLAEVNFRRAAAIKPASAAAWFQLGESNERDYDYVSASRNYARAHQLEPDNAYYRRVAQAFEQRVAAEASGRGADSRPAGSAGGE